MAGIQYFGRVGQTGTATGPHKHVYVKDIATGQYIDPATLRSPFMGLRVGDKRVPAFVQDQTGKINFNPEAGITVTSRFGPRSAPTAGASTDHRGEDWALPEGTPIYFEGAGQFIPKPNQGGYGNLATFITPDKKYELGFGHMQSLGGAAEIPGSASSTTTNKTTPSSSSTSVNDLLNAVALGMGLAAQRQPTAQETMQQTLLGELMKPRQSIAKEFLNAYLAEGLG